MATADDTDNDSGDTVDYDAMPAGAGVNPYTQPTTTREAQGYARKILDSYTKGDQTAGETPIMSGLKANSDQAVQALQNARQRMQDMEYDPRRSQLAWAAANLAPTRSGTMGESFGNAAKAESEELEKQQQFELAKNQAMGSYDLQIPQQQDKYLEDQLALQRLHEQQAGPLAGKAMTVLGREIGGKQGAAAGPAIARSQFGKLAQDEGYSPGSDDYNQEVRRLTDIEQRRKEAAAGIDADDDPDQKKAAMQQYGIPDAPNPYAGFSTKTKTAAMLKDRTDGQKILDKSEADDQQAQGTLQMLDRFMNLNKDNATGGIMNRTPGVKWVTGMEPVNLEMDKISSTLGPLMRQPGMGRMTNLDLTTFMNSTVGRDKPFQVNQDIATGQGAIIQRQMEYNQYRRDYMAVHGHLNGADNAWKQYMKANPVFDPAQPKGSYTLNPHRQDYQTYFRSQMPKPTASAGSGQYSDVTDADRQDPIFAGMTDAQIHGAKVPAHAAGGHIVGYADGGQPVVADPSYHLELADLARSLEGGATGQWGDELNAAVSPGSYHNNLIDGRSRMERFENAYPKTDLAVQGAGAMATGMGLQKGAQLALDHLGTKGGKAAALAATLAKLVPSSMAGKASLAGAGSGVVMGAGAAPDAASMPGDAVEQGLTGAILGPLAGQATKLGVRGVQMLIDKARGMGITGGAQKVLDAIRGDGMTMTDLQAALDKAGRNRVPTTTVADVGGPRLQGLTRAVASKSGDNVDDMTAGMQARNQSAGDRVAELVNHHLAPDDYLTKQQDLTDQLYSNAKPLYDKAYEAFPAVQSDALSSILSTPAGKQAGRTAFRSMQNKQIPIGAPDATGMVRAPSLQYLDEVKRALDDQINVAERGGATSAGRDLRQMRNQLVSGMDEATQGPNGAAGPYQDARAQFKGDLEVRDALNLGRDEFQKMTPQELAAKVSNMSFAEKDALRTGAAEGVFQQIANAPYSTNPATRLANNAAMAQRFQTLFDKPSDYKQFMGGLQQEMENFNRARAVTQAGAAGQTAAGADALGGGGAGETAYEMALGVSGHPVWAGARAARWAANKMMRPSTADDAAEILNTPVGSARQLFSQLRDKEDLLNTHLASANRAGVVAAPVAVNAIQHGPQGNLASPQLPDPSQDDPSQQGQARGGRFMHFDDGGSVMSDLLLMRQLNDLQSAQAQDATAAKTQ